MKKWSKVIGVAVVAAMAALCLAACGGGGSSSGSAAASSSGSANAYEPIYVVTKWSSYSNLGEGSEPVLTSEWTFEYDEHGNNTKQIVKNLDPVSNEWDEAALTWSDFDEYGYPGTYVGRDGNTTKNEWTIEDGHAVKNVSSTSTVEYTYYDDGKLKTQVITYEDRKVTVGFDENGRQVSQVTEGGDYPSKGESVWVLDDQGNVVSVTRTTTMEKTGQTMSNEYTFENDENGNITKVYRDGVLCEELEYQKIDNPSTWAWVGSWNPYI